MIEQYLIIPKEAYILRTLKNCSSRFSNKDFIDDFDQDSFEAKDGYETDLYYTVDGKEDVTFLTYWRGGYMMEEKL